MIQSCQDLFSETTKTLAQSRGLRVESKYAFPNLRLYSELAEANELWIACPRHSFGDLTFYFGLGGF